MKSTTASASGFLLRIEGKLRKCKYLYDNEQLIKYAANLYKKNKIV
ncbi:hypothetical protein LXJ15735_16340 [Lacrimispora xylanolytica]